MLILITEPGDPLTVKYTGPHRIIKQTTAEDYLIEFLGTRKEQRVLHVNMLRSYYTRTKFIGVLRHVDELRKDEIEEHKKLTTGFTLSPLEDANIVDDADLRSVLLNWATTILDEKFSHLTTNKQKTDIKELVKDYSNVFF